MLRHGGSSKPPERSTGHNRELEAQEKAPLAHLAIETVGRGAMVRVLLGRPRVPLLSIVTILRLAAPILRTRPIDVRRLLGPPRGDRWPLDRTGTPLWRRLAFDSRWLPLLGAPTLDLRCSALHRRRRGLAVIPLDMLAAEV
jgi:hypothetical protein